MAGGRPKEPLILTDEERDQLQRWARRPKTSRSMAEAMGMSQTAIVRIWHAYGLQPHRTKMFKLSEDPMFVDNVRDVECEDR